MCDQDQNQKSVQDDGTGRLDTAEGRYLPAFPGLQTDMEEVYKNPPDPEKDEEDAK